MSPWILLQYLFLPVAIVAGYYLGGAWNFAILVICFVIRPLATILPVKKKPFVQSHEEKHHSSNAYRLIALLFVPVLSLLIGWALYQVSNFPLSGIELTGLCLSTGIVNGIIGFTLGHEFIHRFNTTERFAGHLLLLQNNYLHYSIEHIGGHHVYACTPKDPHTARLNESFYRFLPRAIVFTFINAWEIESKRLQKKNKAIFSYHNSMILFMALQITTYILLAWWGGWLALIFFIAQSAIAIGLLHIINYLQHYGLLRKETQKDYFEKVNAHHAWNSKKGSDRSNLFQLENHADHHMHPTRTYEQLAEHTDSPEQPTGYTGMIWLALVPPLWFRIMNKRIPLFITQNNSI